MTANLVNTSGILRSPLLRLLAITIAGTAILGIVDGSMWQSTSPNIGYRAGFFFAVMLLFGWRGFAFSYLIFFGVKIYRLGLHGSWFTEPVYLCVYLLSYAGAFLLARRLAGREPWLSRERSTLALLVGAVLAPALPALLLLGAPFLRLLGFPAAGGPPIAIVNWLRETAGILAITPFILVWFPRSLRISLGARAESKWWPPAVSRDLFELSIELAAWTAALWASVYFVERYQLNISYLTFFPPLVFALRHRVPLVTVALVSNALISTTLWNLLHWEHALSAGDLRLLIAIYSSVILLLASVAEERRLFGERMETQERAFGRQKLEGLGVLASGIAHDFNNLLGSILAEAEIIEDLPAGSSTADDVQRIKGVAIRGAEIVRELMIYAGQDQAGLTDQADIDVSSLVENMLELLKVSISKHVVLHTDFPRGPASVFGNASQIRQVVMNLAINASEAIGEQDGVIRVTVRRVRGGRELAPTWPSQMPYGDYVRLQVSDTGSGITAQPTTKIFDPFFSTKFTGRGLGLAVVQGIVRAHNGAIHVLSTPGAGATFQVFLPSAQQRPSRAQGSDPTERNQSNLRPLNILVVEDEEILRMAVGKALRRKGFSVIEASDGSAAMNLLRAANRRRIDLILLDLTMPGTPGQEIVEEARRSYPDVLVIVTSAYGKEKVDASFASHRIQRFIRKPFQLSEIVSAIGDLLSAHDRLLQPNQKTEEDGR